MRWGQDQKRDLTCSPNIGNPWGQILRKSLGTLASRFADASDQISKEEAMHRFLKACIATDTYFRIDGTSEPWSIGSLVSTRGIRMLNENVMQLYEHVFVGTSATVA